MWNFSDELSRWGPRSDHPPVSLPAAEAYCDEVARTHYENFPVLSPVLPRRFRRDFRNVYAYCRWADDLADEVADSAESLSLLGWWRDQLETCYSGEASVRGTSTRHPVFVALHETIRDRAIPIAPFLDLLSAFEQDRRRTTYDTFEQLHDYCRRSADPVGRLVLYVVGEASERHFAWSDSICTGLQLANFWQDVARDAAIGRRYLPREDLERFEYTEDDWRSRRTNDEFRSLVRFEVDRTRDFLRAGLPLASALPGRVGIVIDLFARGGLRILDRITSIDYGVWERRPVVGRWDLVRLIGGAVVRGLGRGLRRRSRADSTPHGVGATP